MSKKAKTEVDEKSAVIITDAVLAENQAKLDSYEKSIKAVQERRRKVIIDSKLYTYDKLFGEYNHTVAQLLLTGEDIKNGQRSHNVRNTLTRLLELGALPVINENDAVATDEIGVENTIGENDTLSAIVAAAIGADLLVLLSDIDGLYDSDPHQNPNARIIPTVENVDDHIYALAGGTGSALGSGGMVTKLNAAVIATSAGCEMVIANGSKPDLLYDIAQGKPVGTRFLKRKV